MTNKIKELFWGLEKGSTKWSGYFDVYERYFNKFVGKSPRILEIGVLGGGSIELWLKYFGEGTRVVATDVNPDSIKNAIANDVKVYIGDQGDRKFWDSVKKIEEPFDIVIDDGSHIMIHQITTLECMFPHLKEGGVFVVEDTHTSYWPTPWGGTFRGGNTFVEHAKRTTDILNQQHFQGSPIMLECLETYKGLYSMSFFNSMVVLEKEKLKTFGITDNKENLGRDL